ncbi:MAG: hypothetical protein AMXMBFR48_25140 [Ignavibacteriales bacterium]
MGIKKLFAEIDKLSSAEKDSERYSCALNISRILGPDLLQMHYLGENHLQSIRSHEFLKPKADQFQSDFSVIGGADFPGTSPDGPEKDSVYSFVCENAGNRSFSFQDEEKLTTPTTELLFRFQAVLQTEIGIRLGESDGHANTAVLNWGKSFYIRELGETEIVPKSRFADSTSFHFAAIVSFFSRAFDLPVPASYVFTGDFDMKGNTLEVGSVKRKFECIKELRPGMKKFFIPALRMLDKKDREFLSAEENKGFIVEIENWRDLIEKVFSAKLEQLLTVLPEKKNKLGIEFVDYLEVGKKEITFTHPYLSGVINRSFTVVRMRFSRNVNPPNFDIFPLDYLKFSVESSKPDLLVILEGTLPNYYTARHFAMRTQRPESAAVYIKTAPDNCYFVDGGRNNQDLVGYQFHPPWLEESNP